MSTSRVFRNAEEVMAEYCPSARRVCETCKWAFAIAMSFMGKPIDHLYCPEQRCDVAPDYTCEHWTPQEKEGG